MATKENQKELQPLPFLPFTCPYIDEQTIEGVGDVLRSGWITTGPVNAQFEAALSELCGGRPVRTLNSGTAALEIALRLAGVGDGDLVEIYNLKNVYHTYFIYLKIEHLL